ncbi:MAG: hypothetical protein MI749_19035, partial [Desulfovibrionales bacterium]|nr:hypothetical protein [Desulfovibrionales bacterium]
MEDSLEGLGFLPPQLDYAEIAMEVLKQCDLIGQTARVNIFCLLRDDNSVDPIVIAAPYAPQPDKVYRVCTVTDGVQLSVEPIPLTEDRQPKPLQLCLGCKLSVFSAVLNRDD